MPVTSQGHYGFHSFPVVDWFCLFIYEFWPSLCKIVRSSVILLLPLFTKDHGYVTFVVITIRTFTHPWLATGFVTRITRRVLHVQQELQTLPERPSSLPVFSGFRVARSSFFYVMFCRSLFVLLFFFFGHCVVCPLIYGFPQYNI